MKTIPFDSKSCDRVRGYLDSYISNELLIETNHEVLRHLEACRSCTADLEERLRVRQLLRQAVERDTAPAALEEQIRRAIRNNPSGTFRNFSGAALLAAAALVVALAGGAALFSLWQSQLAGGGAPAALAGLLNIGVTDHVSCAVNHRMAERKFSDERMANALGTEYSGLISRVRESMPADYEIAVGHKCRFEGRDYVHFILRNDERVLTLAITRKGAESFQGIGMQPALTAAGVPLYQDRVRDFEVAGFESREYLAFLVSDTGRDMMARLASGVAASVRSFLDQKAS